MPTVTALGLQIAQLNKVVNKSPLARYLLIFMTADQIQALITAGIPCAHCQLEGDGRHWYATIVSTAFEGKRLIQRHQLVYATLGNRMQTDEVHALSMKTYSPAEWASQSAA